MNNPINSNPVSDVDVGNESPIQWYRLECKPDLSNGVVHPHMFLAIAHVPISIFKKYGENTQNVEFLKLLEKSWRTSPASKELHLDQDTDPEPMYIEHIHWWHSFWGSPKFIVSLHLAEEVAIWWRKEKEDETLKRKR